MPSYKKTMLKPVWCIYEDKNGNFIRLNDIDDETYTKISVTCRCDTREEALEKFKSLPHYKEASLEDIEFIGEWDSSWSFRTVEKY